MIKAMIKKTLGILGYEIHRKDVPGFNAAYLARLCSPRTVFDVGVGRGTPELYKAFPEARFLLIEPLEEFRKELKELSGTLNCRIYNKAVGGTPGIMEMNVEADPQLSSFKQRPRSDAPAGKKQVEVTTLDAILRENPGLEKPILLKIDTEGNELEVLKGAGELLDMTDFVIAEASIALRFEDSYAFEDLISFMKERGFSVFDFLSVSHRAGKPGANMADVLFKKKSEKGA